MVKTVVVTKQLSDDMIAAGRDLLTSLDNNGVEVKGALWLYDPEPETWKLVIAFPEVKSKGPKKAYERVQSTILRMREDQPVVSLRDISVRDPDDQLISPLRVMLRTGPGISGVRTSRNVINGVSIEDAYIYRLL